MPHGTAYVDLGRGRPGGIRGVGRDELLAVYAVVNTLTQNFEEIRQVRFLIEGREAQTPGRTYRSGSDVHEADGPGETVSKMRQARKSKKTDPVSLESGSCLTSNFEFVHRYAR